MYTIIRHFPSTSMKEEKLKNKTETGNSYSTNILQSTKNIFFTFAYVKRIKPSERLIVTVFSIYTNKIHHEESFLLINVMIQVPNFPSNAGWKLQANGLPAEQ